MRLIRLRIFWIEDFKALSESTSNYLLQRLGYHLGDHLAISWHQIASLRVFRLILESKIAEIVANPLKLILEEVGDEDPNPLPDRLE